MQEEKLVELLHNLMSDICDNNCKKMDGKTQEESEDICAECPAGDHICKSSTKTTDIQISSYAENANTP